MRGRGLKMREASEEKNEGAKSPGVKNPEQRRRRATVPLVLRAFVSGVRSSPLLAKSRQPRLFPKPSVPQCGLLRWRLLLSISTVAGVLREKADCARRRRLRQRARPPARLPRARVFCPRAGWNQPNRKRARGGPSGQRRGAGASSATAAGARAEEARRASLTDRPEPGPTQSGKPVPARPLLLAEDGRRGASPIRLL